MGATRTGMRTTPRAVAGTWRAMGTRASVQLVGGSEAHLVDVRRLLDDLERRWSRFLPESDVATINAAEGRGVLVSPSTAALVHEATMWWEATAGRFDPTVLPALHDAGYVRSFDAGPGPIGDGRAVPGCAGVTIDLVTGAVRVPRGVRLDLGGIGKGAAVDHLVEHLPVAGGVVDLGGDLRVWGSPPEGDGWPVAVDDPRNGSRAALLWIAAGAVATSTCLRRRWTDGDRVAHHLIDPATGRPVEGDLVSVTVVAGRATGADVLAKAAVVAGSVHEARDLLLAARVAGLLVPAVGTPVPVGELESFCYPDVGV